MDKSKGLMLFSLLNVLVILGFFIWMMIAVFSNYYKGELAMFNGEKWMFWIYISFNVLACLYTMSAVGKGALNHISHHCLDKGKLMLLLLLSIFVLGFRIWIFAAYNPATAVDFFYGLFQLIYFLMQVRIAATRHLPANNMLPHMMPMGHHGHRGPTAVIVAGQQPAYGYGYAQQPVYVQQPGYGYGQQPVAVVVTQPGTTMY